MTFDYLWMADLTLSKQFNLKEGPIEDFVMINYYGSMKLFVSIVESNTIDVHFVINVCIVCV